MSISQDLIQDARALDLASAVDRFNQSEDISVLSIISMRLLRASESATDPGSSREQVLKFLDPQNGNDSQSRTNVAIFLHSFVAAGGFENQNAANLLGSLGLDQNTLLEYIKPEKLVDNGLVDTAASRKRYQRIIGLETRTLTYDLNKDCVGGYAELAVLLSRADRLDDQLWHKILQIVGVRDLEPFKVLAMMISLVVIRDQDRDLEAESLRWLASSQWRGHADLPAVLNMFLQGPSGVQLAAHLTLLGMVSFADVFSLFNLTQKSFETYETEFKKEQEAATQSEMNALAMSAMLDDDDDDDDEEIEDEMMVDGQELTPVGGDVDDNNSEARLSEEPEEADSPQNVEIALRFIGEIFGRAGTIVVDESAEKNVIEAAMLYVNAFHLIAGSSGDITRGLSSLVCRLFEKDSCSSASLLQLSRTYLAHISHDLSDELWSLINELAAEDFENNASFWTDYFREFMLPSLDFESPANSLLWRFKTQQRYSLYNDLQTRVAKENFFVKTRFAKADKDTKTTLKKLTKNDAQDVIVPALLEIFAQCPLPSLTVFLNQVESYNIGSLVARSATTRIPALAMDMLPLVIMQQLTASGRLAQQEDGLYESRWFRLLAFFAGEIAAQHPDFDFLVLIGLVLRQISEGDYTQIIILEQLLVRLSGIPLKSSLSIPQVVALGTGSAVRELVQAALSEQTHPSRARLVEALGEHSLLFELFTALCHVYNHILLDGTDSKVVVNRRDQVTELILIYAELAGPFVELDLVEATTKYAVPLQFALTLWRTSQKDLATSEGDTTDRFPDSESWSDKISPELYANFWQLSNYDIVFDENLYAVAGEIRDPKAIEKSALSHKLRVKSVKQKLIAIKETLFMPAWDPMTMVDHLLIPRLTMSPVDAVYTSRFLKLLAELQSETFDLNLVGNGLFSRGVLLAIFQTASPLELESFATFVTDFFEYLMKENGADFLLKPWLRAITDTLLEIAVPTQEYVPLSNAFSFLQKAGPVFPVSATDGEELLHRVRILTVSLTNGDLETSVKSLYAQLVKRRPLWFDPQTIGDLSETDLYKADIVNNDRLNSRMLAGLRALKVNDSNGQNDATAADPKRAPKKGRRGDRQSKAGPSRAENEDLFASKTDMRSDSRQGVPKRLDDERSRRGGRPGKRGRNRSRRD